MSTNYGQLKKPLREKVKDLLWDLQWHTAAEMAGVGGNRYGARVHELKRLGYLLHTEDRQDGKAYRLGSRYPGAPQQKRVKVLLDEADVVSILSGVVSPSAARALADALGSFRHNKEKL